MKETTLKQAMNGERVWENYIRTNGYWHYAKEPLEGYGPIHAVISSASFGNFCNYQDVLVGLSLTFKQENGCSVGWSFESMKDIQILFNETGATYLVDLIGAPMIIAMKGNRIIGCKVNKALVVSKEK